MSETYNLGMNAKLYYSATSGTALASLTEMTAVKNVTVNLDAAEADVTTRGNSGFRANAKTLKECGIDFDYQYTSDDSILTDLRNAWLNDTQIELAALTDDQGTGGAEGPKGTFDVVSISRNEDLEEAITHSISCKLYSWGEWVQVAT